MRAASNMGRQIVRQPPVRCFAGVPNLVSDLKGKVIVCAGAGNPPAEGHGIGAMTSLVLARQGMKVISISNVAENCDTVTAAIKAEGLAGSSYTADCTKYEEVEALCKSVVS